MRALRPLLPGDAPAGLAVLLDAVQSQAAALYTPEQVEAWCCHARTQADLATAFARGRSSRQGRASALLSAVEASARLEGLRLLRTEASQLSRPLLERRGWQVVAPEVVVLAGVSFERWRMIRSLEPLLTDNGAVPQGVDG